MRSIRNIIWVVVLAVSSTLFMPGWILAQEDKAELTLRVLPGDYYKEVIPQKGTTLFIEVKNTGSKEITSIRFDSRKPEGWLVDFQPDSIDRLSAGSSQTVDARVTPARSTGKGNYTVTLIAEASETRSVTSAFLRVEKGFSFWPWVGAGVAALVVAGFLIIFLRLGRQ